MIIRKATIKDFEIVRQLRKEFYIDELKYDSRLNPNWVNKGLGIDTSKGLKSKREIYCLAFDNGKAIGYAAARIEKTPAFFKFRERGHLFNVFVKKQYRNKGIGKKLMQNVISWFRKKGLANIMLYVYSKNKTSHKIYKSLDYEDSMITMYKK